MDDDFEVVTYSEAHQENSCVVRISTSYWHDKNGLYTKKSLKFLKRQCRGYNWLLEDCSMISADEVFPRIINLYDCEDGVYDVVIVNESRDWETGAIDDYDYELIRIE